MRGWVSIRIWPGKDPEHPINSRASIWKTNKCFGSSFLPEGKARIELKVEGRGRWKRKVVVVEEEVDVEGTSVEWAFGPGEAKEALLSLIEGGGEIRIGRKDRLGGGGGAEA